MWGPDLTSRPTPFGRNSVLTHAPGGGGTFVELFEAPCLRQTAKVKQFPIILVGRDHRSGLICQMREVVLGRGADSDRIVIVDGVDEVLSALRLPRETA